MRAAWVALGALLPVAAAGASSWSGFAEMRAFAFFSRATPDDPRAIGWGTLQFERRERIGRARLFASVRLEGISSEERGPLTLDLADRRLRRSPLSLREIYVRLPLATGVDLEAGRFPIGWGRTDGYSPADAFLPRDLSDPFADERLPLLGARLKVERGGLRAEFLASLTTTPWRLPVLGGRYAPFPLPGVRLTDGASDPPRTGLVAARLLASHDDWDAGVWVRAGWRPAPIPVFRSDSVRLVGGIQELPVDRRYAREAGVGGELVRVAGAWIVRAEAGVLFARDPELGSAFLVASGVERGFGDARLLITLATNLEDTPVSPSLLLDRAVLPVAIVAWTKDESWGGWRIAWSLGLEHGDGLIESDVTWALSDLWSASIGMDVPYGDRSGPIGALGDARRARVALRRSF